MIWWHSLHDRQSDVCNIYQICNWQIFLVSKSTFNYPLTTTLFLSLCNALIVYCYDPKSCSFALALSNAGACLRVCLWKQNDISCFRTGSSSSRQLAGLHVPSIRTNSVWRTAPKLRWVLIWSGLKFFKQQPSVVRPDKTQTRPALAAGMIDGGWCEHRHKRFLLFPTSADLVG